MSANNYISIKEIEESPLEVVYQVTERDWESGDLIEWVAEAVDLREAVVAAQKHQEENEVEYGITFNLKP